MLIEQYARDDEGHHFFSSSDTLFRVPCKCKSLQFDRRLLKVQPPTTHEPDFVSCKLDRERINIQILILFYCFQSSWQIYCNLQSQIWTLKGQYSEKISFVPFIVTSNIVINKIHISKIAHFFDENVKSATFLLGKRRL